MTLTESERRRNRESQRRFRERNPTYYRDRRRLLNSSHVCPGTGGYACMVTLPGDVPFCAFCRRTLELMA